jgi:propanol-preferring alcohol dehydrogenase
VAKPIRRLLLRFYAERVSVDTVCAITSNSWRRLDESDLAHTARDRESLRPPTFLIDPQMEPQLNSYNAIEVARDGSLQPTTRELVDPRPGHVRMRVEACGICHSDSLALHPHDNERGRVPGHEVVGRIDALGDGVTRWSVGDRAGVGFLGGHCGECDECRRGNFVACSDQPMTGVSSDGGYAEYVYVRQAGLVAIPDELTSIEAAPLLCAGFTVYNALAKSVLHPRDLVAVQGIGGLGHLAIQYAKAMGADVAAIARGALKQDLALRLGADHYIDSEAVDPGEALRGMGGAGVVIATAASGASMTPLVKGMRHGGRLLTVGASPEPIAVSTVDLIFGGFALQGSLTGRAIENEDNLRFAVRSSVRAMVETLPLQEAAFGYGRMMANDARFRMVLTV